MDIRRKRGLLWCLGLIGFLLVWQAKASDRVVPVGLELSNNNINAFAYDDEGYMWMGTSRGLNRYNGSFFWTFLHEDSLSLVNDNVHALWMDPDSRLWIGTDGGLDCYDLRDQRFKHPSDGRFNPVYALQGWRDSLLVYSDLKGFSVLNRASWQVVASIDDDAVSQSRVLLATASGEMEISGSLPTGRSLVLTLTARSSWHQERACPVWWQGIRFSLCVMFLKRIIFCLVFRDWACSSILRIGMRYVRWFIRSGSVVSTVAFVTSIPTRRSGWLRRIRGFGSFP